MTRLLAGAAAGTVATIPMTFFWEVLHRRLDGEPPRPLPPREVAEGLAVKAGVNRELTETQMQDLALLLHFGYGALTGAVFGLVAPRRRGAAIAAGALFGLGVWTVSYLGWLPALGVRQSPRWDPPARTKLLIASHVVWGTAAGAAVPVSQKSEVRSRRKKEEGRRKDLVRGGTGRPTPASTPGRARV